MSDCSGKRYLCAVIVGFSMMASLVPVAGSPTDIPPAVQDGNATAPNLFWSGFNDSVGLSMLDQSVEPDNWYQFILLANHTAGWEYCEIIIQAWHDRGALGGASVYPPETDANRNLAFSIYFRSLNGSNGTAELIQYPVSPILEVKTGWVNDTVIWAHPSDPEQDHHLLHIPVWFGPQLREADGNGFISGDPALAPDKNLALQDPNSWDFSITVRDANNATLTNASYGEFGISQHAGISAVGNPIVEASPGSIGSPMFPSSQITYSANTGYWVNVSITDLYPWGNPMYPYWIPASNIIVQNTHVDATPLNSEITVPSYFPGSGYTLNVWGQPMAPANNGLVSAGPVMSDFTNAGTAVTELQFWADIPAGTVESVYWGTVTIIIEAGGLTMMDQSTTLYVNAVFPKLHWIGFNETSGESQLDQAVNTDGWYEFTLQANHTMGWEYCEVIIEAWYDEGMFGAMSQYPIENEANENRAFRISYTPYNGMCQVMYPIGPQVQVGTVTDTELWDYYYNPMQLHHRVEIPVWLGSSLVAADGDGFISGDPPSGPDPWMALNDPNSWDFRVTVRDIYYPTAINSSYGEFGLDNQTASFNIPLRTGWNLVSLPLELNNQYVSEILTSITGKWSVVKYFDSQDKADSWKTCRPGGTANDLVFIDHHMGLWINVFENCTLTVYGQIPDSTAITLKAGWNLVGYPTLNTTATVAIALSGTDADAVEVFDPASPNLIAEVGPTYVMKSGEGYWVHVPADTVWTINW